MWHHKTPLFGKAPFQIISWQLSILTSLGLRGAPGYSLDQAHHLPIEMDPLIGMLIYLLFSMSVMKFMTESTLGRSLFCLVVPEGESLMTGKHCSRKLRDHILDQTQSKESEQEVRWSYNFPKPVPSYVRPAARVLGVPQPSQEAPPNGGQVFRCLSLGKSLLTESTAANEDAF